MPKRDRRDSREKGRSRSRDREKRRGRDVDRDRTRRRSRDRSDRDRDSRRRSRDRGERDRRRSSDREKRRRSRDSDGDRSRRRSRDRDRSRSSLRSRDRDRDSASRLGSPKGDGKQVTVVDLTEDDMVDKTDDEVAMLRIMGFCGFDTTKNKKVAGNSEGAVHQVVQRKYRQYMNRKGGFNRPLDSVN